MDLFILLIIGLEMDAGGAARLRVRKLDCVNQKPTNLRI